MAKAKAPKRRSLVPVELSDDARSIVKRTADQVGMSQKEIVGRVLRWFSEQDDVIRLSVLRTLPDTIAADVAKLTLERMAKAK